MKEKNLKRRKIRAFLEISIPLNCLMTRVGVIIGALVGVGLDSSFIFQISLAFFSATFVAAAGNMMNDYFDRDVDAVSYPNKKRPIPSGRLLTGEVIEVSTVCFTLGILFAASINLDCLAIAGFNVFLLILYGKRLKRTGFSGNIAISYLIGSVFLFGGAAVGKIATVGILTVFILVFLVNLGREIIKDVEHIAEDKGKRETLPMKIGEKKALVTASFFIGTAVAFSLLPLVWDIFGPGYLVVLGADAVLVYSVVISFRNPPKAQKVIKFVGMSMAIVAFLLGGIL